MSHKSPQMQTNAYKSVEGCACPGAALKSQHTLWMGQSMGHYMGQSMGHYVGQSIGHYMPQSMGKSVENFMGNHVKHDLLYYYIPER